MTSAARAARSSLTKMKSQQNASPGHRSLSYSPSVGFWVIGENLRLMQRQKPGIMHVDFAACNAYADGLERAAEVKCPALFILGKRDQMTPARSGRELANAVPGATVVEIAGSGHALMAEKPDEVLDALVDFFGRTG